MMKYLIKLSLVWLVTTPLVAQQDAMYTHYMYNTQSVNPAYAGTRDAMTVTGLHRSQWIGFDGAPSSQTITGHTPILNDNLGLGVSLWNDRIGPVNHTGVYVDYSYKIPVTNKGKLSFGLKTGVSVFNSNLSDLRLDEGGDQAFTTNFQSQWLPNFGFGLYYYEPRWYVGLSTPKLLRNDYVTGVTNRASEKLHYFLIAGAVFDLTERLKLKPTTFVKVTAGAPIEADLTMMFIYQDNFWFGPMLRSGDAFGVLMNYQFTQQFTAGYSFDWSFTNTTSKYNGGSIEVMLRYDFIFGANKKIRSSRYF